MEMNSRLIWVSLTPERDEREQRILQSLAESRPIHLRSQDEAQGFVFEERDVVVMNSTGTHERATQLIEQLDVDVPGARVLVRCTLSERPLDIIRRFASIGLLDADEGPELTRSRLTRVFGKRPTPKKTDAAPDWRKEMIGRSFAMQKTAEVIRLVGPRRCTVLITGETGTGKEVVARAIHRAGPRAAGPFVAVNCGAIPAALLEAELFGHTRGAFTGAAQARVGRFEQAEGGTLFLDEIGDLPLELQAKLLRVLQEREFQRLGSSETIRVDARIVAATNCNLQAKVADGVFREDLFYRLNVVPMVIPPLRTREADIRLLAEHFLVKVCHEEQLSEKRITPQTWMALERYEWPGNVRQLENAISSAAILSEDRLYLDEDDFSLPFTNNVSADYEMPGPMALPNQGIDFTKTVLTLERNLVSQALRKTGGNKKAAAEMLQLKRTTLSAKIRVLELTPGVA